MLLRIRTLRVLAVSSLLLLGTTTFVLEQAPIVASAASKIKQCTYPDLQVSTAWGTGGIAGHAGIPFVIANISHSSCWLDGYATYNVMGKFNDHVVQISHDGGAYATVKPKMVILTAGGVASFGLTYGDGANQSIANSPQCTMGDIYTKLPVAGAQGVFENIIDINICASGYGVTITPIEKGPTPKLP